MVLETIAAGFIGVIAVRACWEAWKGRHNLQTGDPERWNRYFAERSAHRRNAREIHITVKMDTCPEKKKSGVSMGSRKVRS